MWAQQAECCQISPTGQRAAPDRQQLTPKSQLSCISILLMQELMGSTKTLIAMPLVDQSTSLGSISVTYRASQALTISTAFSVPKKPFTVQVPGFFRSL